MELKQFKFQQKPLGQILVEYEIVSSSQLEKAIEIKKQSPEKKLGDIIIEEGYCSDEELAKCIALQRNVEYYDLSETTIDNISEILYRKIDEAIEHSVLKMKMENVIIMSDTADRNAFEFVKEFLIKQNEEYMIKIGSKKEIQRILKDLKRITTQTEDIKIKISKEADKDIREIITKAIIEGASDIHFFPKEKTLEIKYRIDGLLIPKTSFREKEQIIGWIKANSGLGTESILVSKDGKMEFQYSRKVKIDIRVSIVPTHFGESAVLRLLVPDALTGKNIELDDLNIFEREKDKINLALKNNSGLIITTGPTGSGKTTFLYACLKKIANPNINLLTIEDPVEYSLPEARQVSVNEKANPPRTFASTLRAFLRHDPDVILVGEIRDEETAKVSIQAGMTGHLVLTTLHTNNAIDSLNRLEDFGIRKVYLTDLIRLISAQRLLKTLCNHCAIERDPTEEELKVAKHIKGVKVDKIKKVRDRGPGCINCNQTGYYGRQVVLETILFDDELKEMILNNLPSFEIINKLREKNKFLSMFENAMNMYFKRKIFSLEEIMRIFTYEYTAYKKKE